MTDESTVPAAPRSIRELLVGDVTDGAIATVRGTVVEVSVARNEQSGLWARGRVLDSTGSIEFVVFPRAYAATDEGCFSGEDQVDVTGRLSISEERTLLVVNRVSAVERSPV
ncbi:hypothetical protein [Rhodococcus sp. IEGM 1374]|uniref:hypothetical protein n=1 Tax=Rhodococcus sp. IEGM 1374 TaxID=3082221 RepID=UPI002953E43F|nr:hypothetical protein [Rhodococcus sp. IEGM 1374]MDV7991596.1 hypothetical protein [Rhodococcus sp. IEGM 1374]